MNKLTPEERASVVRCLVDGNSMRATARITGVARNTINKLLVELGAVCSRFQHTTLRKLACRRVQVDEVWAFCYCKQRNLTQDIAQERVAGDVWTWAAIDADTKLVPCWTLGKRDPETAEVFVSDLAGRLADRIQLSSDGLRAYLTAIVKIFGEGVDYAQLVKVYEQGDADGQRRYSPPECVACERHAIIGEPDPDHINTSYIERQNLTMRMGMRRFTRLTNAFSKKIENHAAAVSLHMMYYNFARVHQSLRTTPAVAAGVANHIWTVEEIVALLATTATSTARLTS
ncbi:MAG: IS1 family transposase [Bryobacteraceae bacterium]